MTLSVVILDSDEKFIQFLNPNLLTLTETHETYGLRTLKTTYNIENIEEAQKLFKHGHKIFVSDDHQRWNDCLYIINTKLEKDLYEKNSVTFEPEEKLVELNNAFFTQTDINNTDFTVTNNNTVTINYNALFNWFGDYFQIGVIQNCLSTYLQKVTPTGTMTLMELLRYIEEETGNVFVTQYYKDAVTNQIHCYLNFLNPKSTTKNWELRLFYKYPTDEDVESSTGDTNDTDILETDDIVEFPTYVSETALVPANLKFRLNYNGQLLLNENATTLGFDDDDELYEFIFNYTVNHLQITIGETVTTYDITIPSGTIFEMYDTTTNQVVYSHEIISKAGNVHEEILDLGYNTENITYDTDESDTYTAIAPIIASSDDLTYEELNQVIQDWINLEVHKGDIVPMIVQKRNITGTDESPMQSLEDAKRSLGGYTQNSGADVSTNISSNYWARPVKYSDSTDSTNKSYEFNVATAYWAAPFTKLSGELFVADDDVTGIEYTHILGNKDNINEVTPISTPKMGQVETSDIDPYAIFNDVCMKLKDKRYPEIQIEADVANLKNGQFNNYNVFDQVYIKIPGINNLVVATVDKTEKNPMDMGANKVELANYSVNKKVAPKQTGIESSNLSYKYPAKKTLTAKLVNLEYDSQDSESIEYIPGRLLTFTIFSVEDNTEDLTNMVYTKKTNSTGNASITLNLTPGDYIVEVTFGGDVEYASSNNRFQVNVGGVIEKPAPVKTVKTVKTTTVKERKKVATYYSGNGVSPDKKLLCAIGKKATGNTFYVTVFERKCPHCGSKELYWSIYWTGNETKTTGIFPVTGHREKGSTKGRIFCKKCEKGWNCLGTSIEGAKKLKVKKKTRKSSKAKAYELKNGKRKYGTTITEVSVKKVTGNTGTTITRNESNTGSNYSGIVSDTVKKKSKNIVGNSKGIAAAKKLAKWVGRHIKHEKREGLYQAPSVTLKRKRGNCICQTDLFLQMCDAAGVTSMYTCQYIHVGTMKFGKRHFFARINGIDVDVDAKPKHPWGHASYAGRTIYSRKTYPQLPIDRKYRG